MRYNFDEPIDRRGTACLKHDALDIFYGDGDIIPLWVADTDFRVPDFIVDAIRERLEHPIFGYTFRCDEYHKSICTWLSKRNDWCVKSHWLHFTSGVIGGIEHCINALTKLGDGVVIQPPIYPPFAHVIESSGRVVINNPLKIIDGRYEIDFEDLEHKLRGAKVFLMCNPHNPTGRVFTYDELTRIGELCLKYGVYIVSDEIHSDIVLFNNRHIHIASISKQIADITATGIAPSKTFNIPGLSTAVAIISNPKLRQKFAGHEIQNSKSKSDSVDGSKKGLRNDSLNDIHHEQGNIFGMVALRAAYAQGGEWVDELVVYIENNIDYVIEFLKNNTPKIRCTKPESTFLLWLDCRDLGLTQSELVRFMLDKAHLGLNNGSDFGVEGVGFMRLNVGTQRAVLTQALEQLKRAYDERF